MERKGNEDDLKTCPLCGSRKALFMRWLPDIDHRVHEKTEVGCNKCKKYFSEKEDRHAIAAWNFFVIEEMERSGKKEIHSELYKLLYQIAQAEKQAQNIQTKIKNYLEENITPTCDLKKGDRFKVSEWPNKGIWSVNKVYSAYFWNTGPTWIIDAVNVLKNGRLGEEHHDFLMRDRAKMEILKPFWPPTKWKQVINGDKCLYSNQTGVIMDVDYSKRIVKINLNGEVTQLKSLNNLSVPVRRFENTSYSLNQ